jgi:hypothetical protein
MIYVAVKKNDSGEWEILKYISNTINQRSPITDETIGDISRLDAAGRLAKGFWIQKDVYVNNGEFTELDNKEITFDDVNGEITNTYTYKLMDLSIIRDEMKNRVRSYRTQLSYGFYTKGENQFDISSDGRVELQGLIIESLLDSTITSVAIRLQSGVDVTLTVSDLKELYLEIAKYREGLFDTEAQLILAIDSAADYEAIRNVSVWGEQVL